MDIRIYKQDAPPPSTDPIALKAYLEDLEDHAYTGADSEKLTQAPLIDVPANTIETIGGKVVKFMLTAFGTDAFDPQYGANLTLYNFINLELSRRIRFDINNDLLRCTAYIKNAEKSLPITAEKLMSLSMLDFIYNDNIRTRFDVYVEILTTKSNAAILQIPIKAGS